jgi:hypothetical protein
MSPNETFSPARAPQVDCFVLLLTRDGSHGLDLSMLTHLFLVDQCWDPAVEQQVRIARLPDDFPDGFPDDTLDHNLDLR